jgi:hypothetical protein
LWSEHIAQHVAGLVQGRIAEGQPSVVEYRLQRNEDGQVVMNNGEPVIAYGADDHCSAEQLQAARKLQPMLEMIAPLL